MRTVIHSPWDTAEAVLRVTFKAAQHCLGKQESFQRDSLTKQPEPPEEEQGTAGVAEGNKPERPRRKETETERTTARMTEL